ncbi:MAG: hypothetical protein D4R64_10890 [Porphyromonadaceae bacterium]|nr:MAG: hypothetical protein D4R64_10890 [Porphyromonadaceae bacterium]
MLPVRYARPANPLPLDQPEIPSAVDESELPPIIRRLKMEFRGLYLERSVLHRKLKQVPSDDRMETVEARKAIIDEIAVRSGRMDTFWQENERWKDSGILPDESLFQIQQPKKEMSVPEIVRQIDNLGKTYKELSGQINILGTLSIQEKKDLQDKIDKTIELAEAEIALVETKQLQIQKDNTRVTLWQKVVNVIKSGGMIQKGMMLDVQSAMENGMNAAKELNPEIEKLKDNLVNLKNRKTDLSDILNAESLGDAIPSETLEQLETSSRSIRLP